MQITRTIENERLRLSLQGRLDGAWSEHTGAALTQAIEEGWHDIALDLANVSFISSAGIRVLVIHFKQLTRISGLLTVVKASREVRTILEMAGLGMMVAEESEASVTALTPERGAAERLDFRGLACDIYPLHPEGQLRVRLLEGTEGNEQRTSFSAGSFGLGLGAIGADAADCQGRFGEAIAMGGAVVVQPADGRQTTDYVLSQGDLVPEITLRSGLVADGSFRELLRFDAREAGGHQPLSALMALILDRSRQQSAGFAMIAETEALVGASLLVQPDAERGINFTFPEVRNQLRFTAEPAWRHSLSLVTGFVAPTCDTALAPLLRPIGLNGAAEEGPWLHAHAATFPYRPLPKGLIELPATVRTLLEEETALGILHLLHDWRPGGVGESRFRRGALWISPITDVAAMIKSPKLNH